MSDQWRTSRLGDVVTLYSGTGFPPHLQGGTAGELPFYKVSDMSLPGNERYLLNANNYVSIDLAKARGWRVVPSGSIAFAKVGAALLLNRRRHLAYNCLIDNNMMAASPSEDVSADWLYWQLLQIDFADFVQDGALPSINQGQIASIEIPTPSIQEQNAVVGVLKSIDTAIRETEVIIAKLKAVKQGLLHDLLTRGIDANGELRPPQAEAPHLYKQSPLGWIPKEWDAVRIGAVARLQGGFAVPSGVFGKGGLPLVRMSNLVEGCLDLSSAIKIPDSMISSHPEFLLKSGDLLLGMSGSLDSTAVVADSDTPSFLNQRVGRFLVTDHSRLRYRMLDLIVVSAFYKQQLWREAVGAAQLNISSSQVEDTVVPLQPMSEQDAILGMWESLLKRLRQEEALAEADRFLRQALMDDLLTGRVRVTPLLSSEQNAQARGA